MIANYHTHTTRCHHASGSEEDYVLRAIENGLEIFGFSDHVPMPFPDGHQSGFRVRLEALEDYMSQDTEFANSLMIVEGLTLATEQYGIAARKGSGLADAVSAALIELAKDGKVAEIATKYGLQNEICIDTTLEIEEPTDAEMADLNYIAGQGKMIVGYTDFAPISYKDANGNLVGFDVELAKAVAALFNIEVEFKLINWNTKEAELESKAIDLIWNGMTITPERQEKMAVTIPYMNNKQVAVIRKADQDKYKTTDDMKKAIIGAEDGSAGMSCVVKEKEEE